MTLHRGYANTLLDYLKQNERSLPEVISSLRHDASALDQETWEALHRLNRRPKPSFVAGVSPVAAAYVKVRSDTFAGHSNMRSSPKVRIWNIDDIEIAASAKMAQTQDARLLQDAFGFVGAEMNATIVSQLSLHIASGEISIVCGGSGAGKSVLLSALTSILGGTANKEAQPTQASKCAHIEISGRSDHVAKVGELPTFTATSIPLELRGRASLEDFIKVCSKCGLAEPQMFVRPTSSLSSGQRYRLQIALAFLAKPDVLLIDNFCEPLDRYTALAVCRGIRQMARELNIAVVVATAAYERLLGLIEVEQSILLRRGDKPIVKRGSSDEIPKGDIRLKVSNQGPEYAKH
jgi:ABC-type multidrug transport system ATPase subunit